MIRAIWKMWPHPQPVMALVGSMSSTTDSDAPIPQQRGRVAVDNKAESKNIMAPSAGNRLMSTTQGGRTVGRQSKGDRGLHSDTDKYPVFPGIWEWQCAACEI